MLFQQRVSSLFGTQIFLLVVITRASSITMASNQTSKYNTLVIVGAGPVGMISALLLKDHFQRVLIFERMTKSNFLEKNGYTFPIVFSPQSIKILEKIGVWQDLLTEKSDYFGVKIIKRIMGKEFEFDTRKDDVYSHWRSHIIATLYKAVQGKGLDVHFDTTVESIDFENNICVESGRGEVPFDLLLGTDGLNSITRKLLSENHPHHAPDEFHTQLLDNWFAYKLPSKGAALRKKFGGFEDKMHSMVWRDHLRVITSSMLQPREEISVLLRFPPKHDLEEIKQLNELFFKPYVESIDELNKQFDGGYSGKFQHVHTPTYHLNSVQLLGDAANGFASAGDLINVGVCSVGEFYGVFERSQSIKAALDTYDETVGESLRFYASYALRRGEGKALGEVGKFAIAGKLGLVGKHPVMYGVYQEDFDIQTYVSAYKRDLKRITLLSYAMKAATVVAILVSVTLMLMKHTMPMSLSPSEL